MKFLPIIIMIVFLVVCSDGVDGRTTIWIPQNIIDAVSDRTLQIKNYVKEKSRSLKDNVKSKISYYFEINISKNNSLKTETNFVHNKKRDAALPNVHTAIATKQLADNDPSLHMTTPQLIALHGYRAESHFVLTEDGYILTVHRIPHSKNSTTKSSPRKTVLLHHGLLGSSADWVLTGPEKGLAFILSEAGYDVWLANVRGNTYSKMHTTWPLDSYEFWNFTWHDVSQHDLPAVINYIMETKNSDVKINYIGHSMGTTALFALLSTKTEYNKILRAGFALAPVAYMTQIQSPIRLLAKYVNNIDFLMKLLGVNEFLPQSSVMRWLSKYACDINHYEENVCENILFILAGFDKKQFNRALWPIILSHLPAGASTKTLIHYAQEIHNDGCFQQFDYGHKGNMMQYGSPTPPEYPVKKITLPIALFSAHNDWLAGEADVSNLYAQLPNPIQHYIVPLEEFNHIDFIWGIDAPTLVYSKLLQLLEEGASNTILDGSF